ncbi:oligosaccharide flippase family protein [Acinetobacter indicus]|uniref:oligosaccharide flippase family protein n=1 Tax=Acinetobacter indicus TaxID=756892 RepID=UPI0020907631|nr:oligosaccharide flippase family protein [Acinetobacter indicus]
MISEKFVNIFGLIFINSQMARYLGAENFGKIAFAASIFIFVQVLSQFGSGSIFLKRMSSNPTSGLKLAQASQPFRKKILLLSSISILIYLYIYTDHITFFFGIINMICCYFIVIDYLNIYNNSQLRSKINTITNVLGLIFALIIRYALVKLNFNIYWFSLPLIVFAVLPYTLRKLYFIKKNIDIKINKKETMHYTRYIKKTGGSLVIAALSVTIYTQISNFFLAKYISFSELGIFNIAMTIGVSWNFILNSIGSSYFSKIYALKEEQDVIHHFKILTLICLCIGIFVLILYIILGRFIIDSLYGPEFYRAIEILPIIVIGATLSALGTNHYRFVIKHSGYIYLTKKMFITSFISVPLSYFLIKHYQILGAAYCFLIIEFLSLTLLNYFFKRGMIFNIHLSLFSILVKGKRYQ